MFHRTSRNCVAVPSDEYFPKVEDLLCGIVGVVSVSTRGKKMAKNSVNLQHIEAPTNAMIMVK